MRSISRGRTRADSRRRPSPRLLLLLLLLPPHTLLPSSYPPEEALPSPPPPTLLLLPAAPPPGEGYFRSGLADAFKLSDSAHPLDEGLRVPVGAAVILGGLGAKPE